MYNPPKDHFGEMDKMQNIAIFSVRQRKTHLRLSKKTHHRTLFCRTGLFFSGASDIINEVFFLTFLTRRCVGIGRRGGLKIRWAFPVWVRVPPPAPGTPAPLTGRWGVFYRFFRDFGRKFSKFRFSLLNGERWSMIGHRKSKSERSFREGAPSRPQSHCGRNSS